MKKIYLLLFCFYISQNAVAQVQQVFRIDAPITVQVQIKYPHLLFEPSNQSKAIDGKLPMIVFLHGAGERGINIELVKIHGPPKIVEQNTAFPFIVLSPQCPEGERWDAFQLGLLIDQIAQKYPVDKERIYLTGLSMGGFGTWDTAIQHPDKFAAIAPICGGSIIHAFQAEKTKHIPTWVFHGALDSVVPISNSAQIVKASKKAGSSIKFTVYSEAGHDSWTETYNNPELYEWFLSHSLKSRK